MTGKMLLTYDHVVSMFLLLVACLDAALISLDFRLPTDIQAESIPLILGGGDVLMVIPAYPIYSF